MELKYSGKTKDVYALKNGNLLLKFKDDMTGRDGVFDPGANAVGLSMKGAGRAGLRLTKYFFELLNERGIPTHYVNADVDNAAMIVQPADMFGEGIEVICRYRAVGSFLRRYGKYVKAGQALDAFVEVTLKDDERGDPPISEDALAMLGILSHEEYAEIKTLTVQIADIVKHELAKKGLELYDIKFEFGRVGAAKQIALIDEISGGNMRVYKNGKPVSPIELAALLLDESSDRRAAY